MKLAVRTAAALVALCAAVVWLSSHTPAPAPATASPSVFSAERAMAHVRAIAQRPRPSGSAAHAAAHAYLAAQLAGLGLDPQVQDTTGIGTRYAVAAHIVNVIARLRGRSGGGPAVLLAAHYDSVVAAPGAGDDGAAVAALLETVRALRAGPPLAHDVIVLFTDGEEGGLTGASAFVREHPWARDVAVTLNFEGRGTGGPSIMFQTSANNLDLVRTYRRAPGAFANSLSIALYRLLPNDTDFSEFEALGQPGMNFAFTDGLERYHTSRDTPDALSTGSLQHHGEQALALARVFADGPLPRPSSEDGIFFTVPRVALVVYPERFAWPLAAITFVGVVAGYVVVRRRERRHLRSVILGVIATIVATVMGALMAYGVATLLERRMGTPSAGGWSVTRALYATAIALLALSPAAALWAIIRRWGATAGAQIGAVLVWTLLAVAVTWKLAPGSYLFVWPALAGIAAAIAGGTTASWIATIVIALIVVPPVYMTSVVVFGVARTGAIVIGLFVPLTAWLLGDRLEELTSGRRWVMPLATLTLGAAALAACVVVARPSGAHPASSMIGYALDPDMSQAWLVTPADAARRGSWTAAALGPGARVAVPRQPSAAAPEWITTALAGEVRTLAAPVPPAALGAPAVVVISDRTAREGRTLDLRVRPAPGTYAFRIRSTGAPVRAAAVDGRALDMRLYRAAPGHLLLGFVAPPADGFTLTLSLPDAQPLELDVIARSPGLPAVPGMSIPPRPEGVVQIHTGDLTIVHKRFRF
jgi:hypothetical protein